MAEKTVNYTPEMTVALTVAYQAADSDSARAAVISEFAEKFGKKISSVRAKLVREGTYIKAAQTRKRSAKKSELVAAIAARTGAKPEVLDSLEKATAKALGIVLAAMAENDEETETEETEAA